jgi:hypothetical protein
MASVVAWFFEAKKLCASCDRNLLAVARSRFLIKTEYGGSKSLPEGSERQLAAPKRFPVGSKRREGGVRQLTLIAPPRKKKRKNSHVQAE